MFRSYQTCSGYSKHYHDFPNIFRFPNISRFKKAPQGPIQGPMKGPIWGSIFGLILLCALLCGVLALGEGVTDADHRSGYKAAEQGIENRNRE